MRAGRPIFASLLLLTGAVINVGVAWWSAAYEIVPASPVRLEQFEKVFPNFTGSAFVYYAEFRSFAGTRRLAWIDWEIWTHDVMPTASSWYWSTDHSVGRAPPFRGAPDDSWGVVPALITWGQVHLASASEFNHEPTPQLQTIPFSPYGNAVWHGLPLDDSRGWPMRCLWCSEYFSDLAGWLPAVHGGIVLQDRSFTGQWGNPDVPRSWRVLPYRVLWIPFAINTAFYATLLWLSIAGIGQARRALRRRRGLCAQCGYDLRGQTSPGCPECGKGRATAQS